jgi:hypothetical protein
VPDGIHDGNRTKRLQRGTRLAKNLDVVKGIVAAWERGDFTDVRWTDRAIEFVGNTAN